MRQEAGSNLTQFRLVADNAFLKVGEERSCKLVDALDVAEYRTDTLGRKHFRPSTRFL